MRRRTLGIVAALSVAAAAGCDGGRPAARSDATTDSVPAAPSLADSSAYAILFPVGGTTWYEDSVYTIRWQSRRPGAVNIGAVMGGKDRGHLAFGVPVGTDSLRWHVPAGFVTGFGPASSDAMRIRVEDAGDPEVGVESAPFTIEGTPR